MRNLRPNTINSKQIPKELKKWLYASGSLTQQLLIFVSGDFMERIKNIINVQHLLTAMDVNALPSYCLGT
jgi:translation initiation factor 1 (eIF-1/SUI1)